jgi:hypothetical protein
MGCDKAGVRMALLDEKANVPIKGDLYNAPGGQKVLAIKEAQPAPAGAANPCAAKKNPCGAENPCAAKEKLLRATFLAWTGAGRDSLRFRFGSPSRA